MKDLQHKSIFYCFLTRLLFLAGIATGVIYTSSGMTFQGQSINRPEQIQKDSTSRNDSITKIPRIDFTYNNIKNYIFENLKYPSEAKTKEITGTVHIRFTIDTTGNIKDICIVQPVHSLLDQEAIRLIENMPLWKPIIYNGRSRQHTYTIPIIFELKE